MINSVLAKLDQQLLSPIKEDGIQLIYYIVCIMVKISFINMIVELVFDIVTQILPTLIALLQVPSYSFVNFGARLIYATSGIVPYIIFRFLKQYLSTKSLKELDANFINFIVGTYFILSQVSHLFNIYSIIQNIYSMGHYMHFFEYAMNIAYNILGLVMTFAYLVIGLKLIKSSGYLKEVTIATELQEM